MSDPRAQVASAARMLARAGLVHAFGHVSMRVDDGIAITSTRPLASASPDDVLLVGSDGEVRSGPADAVPIELALHRGIFAARSDLGAIARGHPPAAVVWGVGLEDLPLIHGLGALAGERVAVHPDLDLIATDEQALGVARSLGGGYGLILRGNGALACGATPLEAATRLFFLEDRARVALGRWSGPTGRPPEAEGWSRRLRHVDAELERATAWFEEVFGDGRSDGKG
ncbi:MAG: hypothetical protein KatS3mg013_1644 [Actinomycetota bacterium]|nr:MAG: hypothetical protein KatS3mg013_1644 [Actinomycetota bacterium]